MEDVLYVISRWAVPVFVFIIPLAAYIRGVKVYETFVKGAGEGFSTAIKIIPYLVAMMMAVSIFRQSGLMEAVAVNLGPLFEFLHIPAEIVPLALMRPLSGGGCFGSSSRAYQCLWP